MGTLECPPGMPLDFGPWETAYMSPRQVNVPRHEPVRDGATLASMGPLEGEGDDPRSFQRVAHFLARRWMVGNFTVIARPLIEAIRMLPKKIL